MASMKAVVDLHELDETAQLRLEFNLAQLYVQADRYEEARKLLENWIAKSPEVKPEHHYLLALAYYKLEQHDKALEESLRSLQGEGTPKKGWLQLALALYMEREDYQNAARIVEQLAVLYPSKSHWLQLSALYNHLEREDEALAVYQIAYRAGYLDEDRDIRRLGRMFLNQSIPFRAAQIFQKALEEKKMEENAEAYELLAESWIFARELDKAIEPMRRAAELWKTGDLYVRLAQLHVERDDWEDAVKALDRAFQKNELDARREGRAHMLLGVSHYNLKQIAAAERAFRRASQFEDQREPASQWLKHLEIEGNKGG
jgi:tetratricopeptide (TPR) repeat protein